MKNLVAIIKSGFDTDAYLGLANHRPDYMLPFGSRYRVVDTTLSNFNEHGISKVLIHGGTNIKSTLDHVGIGEPWEMDKREHGLVISAPSTEEITSNNRRMYSYYDSIPFINEKHISAVYIANPMVISRIDITKAYDEFCENDYDVMFLYRKQEDTDKRYLNTRKIIFDENGNVQNVGLNMGSEDVFNLFMDHIFVKRDVFVNLVTSSIEKDIAHTLTQAIMNNKEDLNIGVHEVTSHVEYIKDLNSFYKANLNLLNMGIYTDLFLMGSGILTKNKDEPSTKYLEGNSVKNSIIANGSIIEGNVENSVIFRQVKIHKDAIVKNSVVFQGAVIEEGAIVENAILDKNVKVKKGVEVKGTKENPYVATKNKVLEN